MRGDGWLWAAGPVRMLARGDAAVAWQHAGLPRDRCAPLFEGPEVHLSQNGMVFTAGLVPQYALYYWRRGDDSAIVVCSHVAPLLTIANESAIDVCRLAELLAWPLRANPAATAFTRIRRVRAGEIIEIDANGIRTRLASISVGDSFLADPPEDLALELRSRMRLAVRRAIGDSQKVAVYVGGGLDSSGVLALALAEERGAGPREIQAIAEVWTSPGDDRPYLDILERALGLVAVRLNASQAGPWFVRSLTVDGQPQTLATACGEMLLWSEGLRRGAQTALGGHGGDWAFGGDVSFATPLLHGHALRALRGALELDVPWNASILDRLSWIVWPILRSGVPPGVRARFRRGYMRRSWLTPRFLELVAPMLRAAPPRPLTPNERLAAFCQHPAWEELSVTWGQIAASTGAAVVDVYRDPDLLQFIAQIDPSAMTHSARFRGLYREAMRGLLPETIRMRRDKAWGEPFVAQAAISGQAIPLLESLASLQHLARTGLVVPEAFQQPFGAWLRSIRAGERAERHATDGPLWHQVWPALAIEAFLRSRESHGRTAAMASNGA